MPVQLKLAPVTVDCPDAPSLARFYATITGGRVTFEDEGWAEVEGPNGAIDFQTAPDHRPPILRFSWRCGFMPRSKGGFGRANWSGLRKATRPIDGWREACR